MCRRSGQPEATPFGADGAVRKLSKTCGNSQISRRSFNALRQLGLEIHSGQQPSVFDGGFVGINSQEKESEVGSEYEAHSRNGSSAGSRKGQRSWPRPRPRSRSSREAEPFRSRAIEAALGAEFRVLAHHYEALAFEDGNGLWVVVKIEPLGTGGPLAHLLVAVPADRAITPRAWAFDEIGHGTSLFPLKHTNFPDASICAFTKSSLAWVREDGLLPLIDHYSLWIAKSLHRTIFGWWPGTQVGACALYRRREFVARELCGCESGKSYSDCHQLADLMVPEELGRREFWRLFTSNYEDRKPPAAILKAAQSKWKRLPDMASIYAIRLAMDEPAMSFI